MKYSIKFRMLFLLLSCLLLAIGCSNEPTGKINDYVIKDSDATTGASFNITLEEFVTRYNDKTSNSTEQISISDFQLMEEKGPLGELWYAAENIPKISPKYSLIIICSPKSNKIVSIAAKSRFQMYLKSDIFPLVYGESGRFLETLNNAAYASGDVRSNYAAVYDNVAIFRELVGQSDMITIEAISNEKKAEYISQGLIEYTKLD